MPCADEPARYIEGKIATPKGPLTVGGLYLPNGNPIGTEKFAYKIAWMDRLDPARAGAAGARGDVRAGRRLQRHARPSRRLQPDGLRQRRALPAAVARGAAHPAQSRPDRRGARLPSRCARATPSGTTRPAPGRRTTACASTTCCSRRRPPTASPPSASTRPARPARAVRPRPGVVRTRSSVILSDTILRVSDPSQGSG